MFGVYRRGGSIGNSSPVLLFMYSDKEEAKATAKRLRSLRSVGERTYYKMSYIIKEIRGV
jgi:hypothetical protein